MGKLPGKTKFAGRRRTSTRVAGFSSHPDSTGGEIQYVPIEPFAINVNTTVSIKLKIAPHESGSLIGFGGWYACSTPVEINIDSNYPNKKCKSDYTFPNWNKVGSIITSLGSDEATIITLTFSAKSKGDIYLYHFGCGIITHKHMEAAKTEKPTLLNNMHIFSPEANFYDAEGICEVSALSTKSKSHTLILKSCNRCARMLPVNVENERNALSFSNHCVAAHRRPCKHTGFGKLKDIDTDKTVQLEYGFQLECRYCKKFEVNAAHNPQRSAAQMKEDGARRRAFELLLTDLYGGSPQLKYRQETKRELSTDIWEKFNKKCFKCGTPLLTEKEMNLDHTRPLAFFWPLDKTATCLCKSCNSQKRDKPPVEYYTDLELRSLSKITGLEYTILKNPEPNLAAIKHLIAKKDWFFDVFCRRPELLKVRDGKRTSELLIKAIQKVTNHSKGHISFDFQSEFSKYEYND